jgi:hypothetical protein
MIMRHTVTLSLATAILICVGAIFTGCDGNPTSVEEFEVQPDLEISSSDLSLFRTGESGTASFDVTYQGFDDPPKANGKDLILEKTAKDEELSDGVDTWEGEQTWTASFDSNSFDGRITESVNRNIIVGGEKNGREVTDTISVTINPGAIIRDFTNDFFVAADYEDASYSGSGGTVVEPDTLLSPNLVNSSGTGYLTVISEPSGSATVTRRTKTKKANRFSFLIRPDDSTDFDLTLTFEASGGNTHKVSLPVSADGQQRWFRYQVDFDQLDPGFNPIADGPLLNVGLSTDEPVAFAVDELRLEDSDGPVADVHDFDNFDPGRSNPFTSFSRFATVDTTQDVAANSDGVTALRVKASRGFGPRFGYIFQGVGVNVDVDGDDVLFFRVKASENTELEIYLEAFGEGGFGRDKPVTRTLDGVANWINVEIPISELGDEPSVLFTQGLETIGFTAGSDADFVIDDIRIEAR